MDSSRLKFFDSIQEAKYYALFKSFMHRLEADEYVVTPWANLQYTVMLNSDALKRGSQVIEVSTLDLSKMSLNELEDILLAEQPIEPFFTLRDSLQSLSPDTLSFLIQKKLPWELFLKMFLATQGYNRLGEDVSIAEAKKDWQLDDRS